MLRRRRTLSVYAASAPIGSVFFRSSSTAHCAKATAWATVRLQDGVWGYFFEGSDVRIMLGDGDDGWRFCVRRKKKKMEMERKEDDSGERNSLRDVTVRH
jgi:hypothetical protein